MAIHPLTNMEAPPVQTQSPDMSHQTAPGESPLHESSHIRLRSLIVFFVWFFAGLVAIELSVYGVYRIYHHFAGETTIPITGLTNNEVTHSIPPEPRLQPSVDHNSLPNIDMKAMRERDLAEFKKRGWVDDKTGEVRINDDTMNRVIQLTQAEPKKP